MMTPQPNYLQDALQQQQPQQQAQGRPNPQQVSQRAAQQVRGMLGGFGGSQPQPATTDAIQGNPDDVFGLQAPPQGNAIPQPSMAWGNNPPVPSPPPQQAAMQRPITPPQTFPQKTPSAGYRLPTGQGPQPTRQPPPKPDPRTLAQNRDMKRRYYGEPQQQPQQPNEA